MKKNKFILAAAFAAALVSCSQDENLNSSNDYTQLINSGQIAFATANASKADTRAGETLTSLSSFYVTAVNNSNAYYFKEQQFNKEGSVFTSATKFYWPTTGTLSFYAVNYKGTINSTAAVPTYTYTEWDGSKDLVAATVKASEKQIPCPLTFKHLTAKVGYKAMAKDQTEELSYSLYAVRMTTPAKGTYTFANASQGTGTWSIDNNTTKTYDYGLPSSGVTFNQMGSNASGNTTFNVLPVTDGNITFEVEYKVLKNGNVISDFTGENKKTVTVSAPNLTPGKKYVYNFLLTRGTDETITFTTAVSPWETGDTQDVDFSLYEPDGYVDGFPYVIINGVKWATMNVGATKETEYGLYFAWGDTQGHCLNGVKDYTFDLTSYKDRMGDSWNADYTSIWDYDMDAAYVNMSHKWRMPTTAEWTGLGEGEEITFNGVKGKKFTDTNSGKFIFLPYGGLGNSSGLEGMGENCTYNTSSYYKYSTTNCYYYSNSKSGKVINFSSRYMGRTVRAVVKN